MTKVKITTSSLFKRIFSVLTLVSLLVILNSCSLYKYRHKPYYLSQTNVFFETLNGDVYFKIGTGTDFLCKYNLEKKNYREVQSFYEGNEYYNFESATSNSNYLFVYLTPADVELPPMIKVFNKSFEEVNKIIFAKGEQIVGLACSDEYVYIYKKESETNTYSLIRNDFLSNSSSILVGDLNGITSYQDNDISLFFCLKNGYRRYLGKYGEKTTLIYDYSNERFTDKLLLKQSNDSLIITYCGIKHSFKKQHNFNYFYEKAFLFDNDLYFATYSYMKSKECGQEGSAAKKCFCGMKESYLFRFDTLTNELFEIGSFNSGSYLIDYSPNSVEYYYDGALYINNELVKECEKIQADPLVKINAFERIPGYDYKLDYYLSYYNGNFYGIY